MVRPVKSRKPAALEASGVSSGAVNARRRVPPRQQARVGEAHLRTPQHNKYVTKTFSRPA